MAPSTRSSSYPMEIAARMAEVCADLSFSDIARRTESNRETARRYVTQGKPSAEFVARLCESFGVSGTWLLTGRGPKFDSMHSGRSRSRGRVFADGRTSRSGRTARVG